MQARILAGARGRSGEGRDAMKRPTTVRGVLLAAARLIERRGWCRGHYSHAGRHCVVSAIYACAVEGSSLAGRVEDALLSAISVPGHQTYSLLVWNDAPGRTKAHVLSALRARCSST